MVMAPVEFVKPASEEVLAALAERLRTRNFEVLIVDDAAAATAEVMSRVPHGSQVHTGKSKTLEDVGIFQEFMDNEKYDFIRRRTLKMDRNTQRDEMRVAGQQRPRCDRGRADRDHLCDREPDRADRVRGGQSDTGHRQPKGGAGPRRGVSPDRGLRHSL
jgi:hypothetical protein